MKAAEDVRMSLTPRFAYADACRAGDEWGCNCGPAAVAAICGLTLDELRPKLGDFEEKRYTNPTLMWQILRNIGARFDVNYPFEAQRAGKAPTVWPRLGLARVQWEGPWTKPGVPMAARYRKTHWIGFSNLGSERLGLQAPIGIWDVNCLNNGDGWVSLENWVRLVVPHLLAAYSKASGGWHLTHLVWVQGSPQAEVKR